MVVVESAVPQQCLLMQAWCMLWCDMVGVVGHQARVGTRVFLVVFWPAEQVLGFGPKLPEAEVAKQWVMMCVCWCARVVLRRLEPV